VFQRRPDPNAVAVDLDDVVLDFLNGVVQAVNTEYGANLRREDIKDWDLHEVLDPIIGRSFWAWLEDRDWLWANFSAVPGAMGGLDYLRRKNYYLECVTSKPKWAEHNVWKWLGKWRPPFQRVTIVGHSEPKVDFSDALFLIDDKPANVNEWARAGRVAILFDRPHNQEKHLLRKEVVRAHDWAEVTSIIDAHTALRMMEDPLSLTPAQVQQVRDQGGFGA
jgi:5'(3')-deoxyribonucleotidase